MPLNTSCGMVLTVYNQWTAQRSGHPSETHRPCDKPRCGPLACKPHSDSQSTACRPVRDTGRKEALRLDKICEERSIHEAARCGRGMRLPRATDGGNYAGHCCGSFQAQGDAVDLSGTIRQS